MPNEKVILATPAMSKINWTQIVSLVVSVASVFGVVIPAEWQTTFLQITALVTPLVTIVLRTWFTGKPVSA
jgi:hypothetical protein